MQSWLQLMMLFQKFMERPVLQSQGYGVNPNVLLHDNKSSMKFKIRTKWENKLRKISNISILQI